VTEWIAQGRPSLDLSALRLSRFDEGTSAAADTAL
jgi:hypothetical protein